MPELSAPSSQAIIVSVTGLGLSTKRHAVIGNASVLAAVCPQLVLAQTAVKTLHILPPADDFMQQETTDLLCQLQQKCQQLGIEKNEFSLSLQGQKLALNCNLAQYQQLAAVLQQEQDFMDKFSWLQANYLALANSLEWLNFADNYELSRTQACRRFAHLRQQNQGLHCYLSKQADSIDFVLESPINLFKVALA